MLWRRICLVWVLAVVAASMAFGQTGATGTILGTITDSTGAVLPNVKVTRHQHRDQRRLQHREQFCRRLQRTLVEPWFVYGFSGDRRAFKNP